MKRFHTFAIAGLALLGLSIGACDRRAPTADTQGKDYVPTRDPNAPAPAPAPDMRQPVAGHEPADTTPPPSSPTTPAPTTAPAPLDTTTTPAPAGTVTTTTSPDIFWVSEDGRRMAIDDSTMITRLQQKLTEAGVYSGPTDGRASTELEGAIRQFQAKRGLAETGMLDSRTAGALNVEWDKANAASDLKAGAKELGKDIKDDAKKAGQEVKAGAKDVKDFVDDKVK